MAQVYFDTKNLVGKDMWYKSGHDNSWCDFLNDHGIWMSSGHNGSTVSGAVS